MNGMCKIIQMIWAPYKDSLKEYHVAISLLLSNQGFIPLCFSFSGDISNTDITGRQNVRHYFGINNVIN